MAHDPRFTQAAERIWPERPVKSLMQWLQRRQRDPVDGSQFRAIDRFPEEWLAPTLLHLSTRPMRNPFTYLSRAVILSWHRHQAELRERTWAAEKRLYNVGQKRVKRMGPIAELVDKALPRRQD